MKIFVKWEKVIRSKTLWINALALVSLLAQLRCGFVIGAEEQAAIIIIVNLFLRIITKEGLIEKKKE